MVRAEIGLDATEGQMPGGGVRLLAIDRDVTNPAPVLADELLALDEHAARAAAGVVHPPFERLDHLHQEPHDTPRRVELTTLFAFCAGKLAEKIFVDPAQDIF